MRLKLIRKTELAADISGFDFADPEGKMLPAFTAGAHIDIHLGDGLIRQYSLCNDPEERHRYSLGVLRDPRSRGGSVAMHALREGDELEVGAPKNHFPLAEEAAHSLLIAGGIGITPLLCMAERLGRLSASFELHYCTRSPERSAFRDRLSQPDLAARTWLYYDSEGGRPDFDGLFALPSAGAHLYVCGPGGFIDLVLDRARAAGWAESRLHREYFAAPAPAKQGEERPFQVKLASSGLLVDVAKGQSVVQALAAAGVDVLTSCEEGVCGTCLTRIIEGEPDHRDVYLTTEEKAANDQFLPCCSRALSPLLVLDL